MTERLLLAGWLTAVGGVALAACSSEITCKDACACEGLAEDKLCLSTCENDRKTTQAAAAQAGCTTQQSDLDTCAADHASCDASKKQYVYPTDACKTESAALDKCKGTSSQGGSGSN